MDFGAAPEAKRAELDPEEKNKKLNTNDQQPKTERLLVVGQSKMRMLSIKAIEKAQEVAHESKQRREGQGEETGGWIGT